MHRCPASFTAAGSSIGWRWPFVIVAVPSIVLALVMVLTTEEPQRGVTEQALHQTFEVGFRGAVFVFVATCEVSKQVC